MLRMRFTGLRALVDRRQAHLQHQTTDAMAPNAPTVAESDIDTSVLCELTDQDLKELGVSLGHRRKMLRAIAELVAVPPTQLQPALTEPKPKDTAERRQVTVMFSDLVGSTAPS